MEDGVPSVERTASGTLKPTAAPFEPGKHTFAPAVPPVVPPMVQPVGNPMMVPVALPGTIPMPEVGYAAGHMPHNYGNEYMLLNMAEMPIMEPEPQLAPEIAEAILKQVEFYFSDANLATDDFLLKLIKRSASGWVSLHTIAKFKRISKYTTDTRAIASALYGSEALVISPDGRAIRRSTPLPDIDPAEVAKRTVVAENIPSSSLSIDALTEMFSRCGTVKVVRILKPGEVKLPPPHNQGHHHGHGHGHGHGHHGHDDLSHSTVYSKQVHVQVEFASQDEAANACKTLTDDSNWRAGMKVRPLLLGGRQKTRGGAEHDHHEHEKGTPGAHQHQRHQHLKDDDTTTAKGRRARSSSPVPIPAGPKDVRQGRHSAASSLGDKQSAIGTAASLEERSGSFSHDAMEEALEAAKKAVAGAAHNQEVAKSRRRGDSRRQSTNNGDHHDAPHSRLARDSSGYTGDTISARGHAAVQHDSGAPSAAHAKLLQDDIVNSDSGADTASSGGEDAGEAGKTKKVKRKSKSEYAKWASASAHQALGALANHHPGHHKIHEPRMPDGTRGFSMGRGKAMPPPPGL